MMLYQIPHLLVSLLDTGADQGFESKDSLLPTWKKSIKPIDVMQLQAAPAKQWM